MALRTSLRTHCWLRNKLKIFEVKFDEVTTRYLGTLSLDRYRTLSYVIVANRISLGHFALGNKFTG